MWIEWNKKSNCMGRRVEGIGGFYGGVKWRKKRIFKD